ncbi:hypothetical protein AMTR_s00002p00251290 [Amborella trichopoda]|uniref:RRM domain-containing protein n=1 Tax=Amborella trichopoda TaxID=13333 RepID=W1NUI6_AMBTC|nr:hypothetical protein AMTR_s00002p00251290 [Amborella trichopoda]
MAGKEDMRVFVGGLSWDSTDRQLEDAFSEFGKVLDAQWLALICSNSSSIAKARCPLFEKLISSSCFVRMFAWADENIKELQSNLRVLRFLFSLLISEYKNGCCKFQAAVCNRRD